jgi:hypothetical protein
MKSLIFLAIALSCNVVFAQKVIFLHHSTGGGVYNEGNVSAWFEDYNSKNLTNYEITERAYPDSPYPWENYPYDYWNLWINGACNNDNSKTECLSSIAAKYDVIIYKHCFPGAGIGEDEAENSVSSSYKSLGNYKLQYRALRTLMDSHPNNKFIVWTLAPLHRNATDSASAARAAQFVNWVKNQWLSEDGKSHSNIFVFDFWGNVAESSANPSHGKVNCLKYDYEGSHDGDDSHPNTQANQNVGPIFGQFIVDCIKQNNTSVKSKTTDNFQICYINCKLEIQGLNEKTDLSDLYIYSVDGHLLYKNKLQSSISVPLPEGMYLVSIHDKTFGTKAAKICVIK